MCLSRYIPFTMTWLHEEKQMKVYIFNHTQEHFSCVLFFFCYLFANITGRAKTLAVVLPATLYTQLKVQLQYIWHTESGRKHFTSLSDVLRFDIEDKVSPTSQSRG